MFSKKDHQLIAENVAKTILEAFQEYRFQFKVITQRARRRFESRDWHGAQSDAVERIDLYGGVVDWIVARIQGELKPDQVRDIPLWIRIRFCYAEYISERKDIELAETFFNSISRRIFTTVGVDARLEFISSDFNELVQTADPPIYRSYPFPGDMQGLIHRLLSDYSFDASFENQERDAILVAEEIERHMGTFQSALRVDRLEILNPVFYRNKGAYIIGRICCSDEIIPLVIALRHPPGGIQVDAVLLTVDEVSIVFSFTRSYFHVEIDDPRRLVRFLKSILPLKRNSELYISIGFNKHGKTELYRELMDHLEHTQDQFVIARGERGMVMAVFTLRSFDMVFKIIRDRFAEPKTTTREAVKRNYRLVFRHDRAGRLVDAQEFEFLEFSIHRFSPELLQYLLENAGESVAVRGDQVIIRHLYTERRMVPLDIYVKEAPQDSIIEAVQDYGQAIKDLAATNIFPGDILLKNFGVTRHGRVVFYDYDELIPVTECKFRRFPKAQAWDDEFENEPWFFVDRNDIFPEEFLTFLGLSEPYRSVFVQAHGDLFGVEFWKRMQQIHQEGEIIDIFPYKKHRRFHPDQEHS